MRFSDVAREDFDAEGENVAGRIDVLDRWLARVSLATMGFLDRLFGGGNRPVPPGRDVAALVAPLAMPAAQLVPSAEATGSYLGGSPTLPSGTPWPNRGGTPLTFLACIDLAALRIVVEIPWLPEAGQLLFFYDAEDQPWGSAPGDRSGWAVVHVDGESLIPPAAPRPATTRRDVAFRRLESLPSSQRPQVEALDLDDAEAEFLDELRHERAGASPCHQLGGFPLPIQGDEMEAECERMFGDRRAGAGGDWRLLLQMDSDGDLMWGDAGMLYFWVREQDARAGRFDNVWLVLQCY